jgi:hypothetical protein
LLDPVLLGWQPGSLHFTDLRCAYSVRRARPIPLTVDELAWTFARGEEGEERLTIIRDAGVSPPSVRLIVTVDGAARSFDFTDLTATLVFQSDMEAFLLKSGWSFIEFAPERRTGIDRRRGPRLWERRRWWTDGTVTVKQFLDWDSQTQWPPEPHPTGRKRGRARGPA